MDVAVTTVVTDPGGRVRRRTQATVHLVFRGYNQQAERFTFRSDAGFFHWRELHDSIVGDFAIFKAFSQVAPGKDGRTKSEMEIAEEGAGLVVRSAQNDCQGFELRSGELWAKQDCSAVEFHLGHGQMIRLLRDCGLEIEDLLELRPGPDATTRYPFVTLDWARQWPCEEVWKARKPA